MYLMKRALLWTTWLSFSFLLLLQIVRPHSLVNETITASCQTNLSPYNIKRYEEVLQKPQLRNPFNSSPSLSLSIRTHAYLPTYRGTHICVSLLVSLLTSFKTNLSEKILLSVKQLHEERRTAEVEKCK